MRRGTAAGAVAGVLLCLLPLASRRLRAALPFGACLLGIVWAGFAAELRLADALPAEYEGRDVELTGVVASLPQRFENGVRFDFDVERALPAVPARISLAWYRGWRDDHDEPSELQPVHAGERWTLVARLKRPHGNVNPHGYDYEAALLERGIRATSYVRKAETNRRIDEFVAQPSYAIERLRERLRERILRVLGDSRHAGILVALAVGDQRAIDPWCVTNQI